MRSEASKAAAPAERSSSQSENAPWDVVAEEAPDNVDATVPVGNRVVQGRSKVPAVS